MRMRRYALLPFLTLIGCAGGDSDAVAQAQTRPFQVQAVAQFDEPWAMTFIPGTGQALITERGGALKLWTSEGPVTDVAGVPAVAHGGQGGLGDVVLHPDFANNHFVYLSFAEPGEGNLRGAAVGRGRLVLTGETARIEGFQVIWRQEPKFEGTGHFGHRLAFSPDGRFLFISSGERQQFDPAQDRNSNAGKIVRLTDAGGVPGDNPYYDQGRVTSQIWTMGHRNPLGLAFDAQGRLWEHEMGPRGGDEMNLIERGTNYGYPIVSNGDHYDGRDIPDHSTRPEFNAPEISWTPVISPSSLIFYSGTMFPQWRGSALIGGLSSEALIRATFDGNTAREAERFPMGQRIREVEQAPDGSIYLLEDESGGSGGRMLRLTPAG
jgi:glucose/arabinose dehydrogenase